MVRMVESKFDEDGQPPHRWPSASNKTYDGKSRIFAVTSEEFNAMTTAEIHAIHRHRHILVTGVAVGTPVDFDADGLGMLADVDFLPVEIQRAWSFFQPSHLKQLC